MVNGLVILMAAAAGIFGAGLTILLWMDRQNNAELATGKKVSKALRPTQARYKKYTFAYVLGGFVGAAIGFFGAEWHWLPIQIVGAAFAGGIAPAAAIRAFSKGL
jgi:hypothetical protein